MARKRPLGDVSPESSNLERPKGYMPEDKLNVPDWDRFTRFGKTGQPIAATTVFRGKINKFSKKSILAETWVAVNDENGTMTFINTYDGRTGEGYDANTFTFPIDPKRLAAKRAGMDEVPVDECPVCVSPDEAKQAGIEAPTAESYAGEGEADREQRTSREGEAHRKQEMHSK